MARRSPKPAQQTGQTNFADLLLGEDHTSEHHTIHPEHHVVRLLKERSAALTPLSEFVPVFTVKLVHTDNLALRERIAISHPRMVAALLTRHLKDADRENFAIVLLDTRKKVIGICTASIGDLSSALVHPREVFKAAILANASSIILAHNHPSGDPTPSPEDIAITRRLAECGDLLGIDVVDHIVIGSDGRYVSLKEKGLCESGVAYRVPSRGSR